MNFHLLSTDHRPAALGLDPTHGSKRVWAYMAHTVTVRNLVKAVAGRHRTNWHLLKENVVTGIALCHPGLSFPQTFLAQVLRGPEDSLLKYVEHLINLFYSYDQRGREHAHVQERTYYQPQRLTVLVNAGTHRNVHCQCVRIVRVHDAAFNAANQPDATGVAHQRQFPQFPEPLLKVRRDFADMLQQSLVFDDLQVLEPSGSGHWMSGVGVAVAEGRARKSTPWRR